MFGPSIFCASEMFSRSAHSACACAPLPATSASATIPSSSADSSADFDRRGQRRPGRAVVRLDQQVPAMAGQRVGQGGKMRTAQRQRLGADRLEAGEAVGQRAPHPAQQRDGLPRRIDRRERRDLHRGHREQLQGRGGDQPQRALGADEQLLQVVAGVVLAQAAQRGQDAAVGQHHLEPEHQVAHVAEAQHRGAAGIGRQVAADGAASFRRQRQREPEAGGGRGVLHRCQRRAGLDGDRRVGRVERAHRVHPRQRDDDGGAGGVRRGAAAQAGVAPLRHDRRAGVGAGTHDCGDLGRRRRAHDRQRPPAKASAPVGEPGGRIGVVRQHVPGADGGGEARKEGCAIFHHGPR